MKYKIGDKVRIKNTFIFNERTNSYIYLLKPIRTTAVTGINNCKYILKGLPELEWEEEWIERIYKPVKNRWEILDL